ncbi:hypothetical protein LCGC14_1986650 [marine sediment metagenome]|uniref:Uncharacterized protein n=1 Tax=marine sediment metagenome TaxID=412755 RepID=A0A0F9F7A3_9ZZZZ
MNCMENGCNEEATYHETNRIHGELNYCKKHAKAYNNVMDVLGF